MADLRLILACREYDRVIALKTGELRPKGIDLAFETGMPADILDLLSKGVGVDLGEVSMGQSTVRISRNITDVVAIPVFPLRMFRQGDVYVRKDSGLSSMSQLKGKRLGIEGYRMSSNIWTKGILQHEFGVAPHEVHWFEGQPGGGKQAPRSTPKEEIPSNISLTQLREGQTLSDLLVKGEVDAISPSWPPECYLQGAGVDRMYPDYPSEDRRFYKKTGIWPIQHTVGIRREIVERHPWVVQSLVEAFEEATRFWKACMREHHCMLPWSQRELDMCEQFFGHDMYGHGLSGNNRLNVETFLSYAAEQGIAARKVSVEEFFAPGSL